MAEPIEFTPREEQQLFRDLEQAASRAASYTSISSPQLAQTAGQFATQFPNSDPGVLAAVSEAVASGAMSSDDGWRTIQEATQISVSDPERHVDNGGNKSLFRRAWDSGVGALKTASRYTFAGLNTSLQLANNLSSRIYAAPFLTRGAENKGIYQKPETGLFNGWFASTDLGAMFSGKDAGSGWFIGEAAYEYQQQQVARYRGGFLDDSGNLLPFTLGRTVGTIFTDPNSSSWNVLSGLTDAAVAFRVMPIPGTKAVGAARQGQYGATVAAAADRLPVIKQYSGLVEGTSKAIDPSRVSNWLNSREGRRVVQYLATEANDIEKVYNMFDGFIDAAVLNRIAETTDVDQMRKVLEDILGVQGGQAGFGLTSIDQLPTISLAQRFRSQMGISRVADPKFQHASVRDTKTPFERFIDGSAAEGRRLRAKALPKRAWAVSFEDGFASTEAIRDMSAMMDLLRIPKSGRAFTLEGVDFTRADYFNELARHAANPNGGGMKRIVEMTNEVIVEGVVKNRQVRFGGSEDSLREATRALLRQHQDVQDKFYGFVGDDGFATNFFMDPADVARGALDDTLETGEAMISPPMFRTVNSSTGEMAWNVAPVATAGLSSEMMRQVMVLPNMDQIRRATSKISFLFEKNGFDWTRTSIGEANMLLSMLDNVQTKAWRPAVMMTGGYITRNLADSLFRSTLAPGIKTGPAHPIKWIAAMSQSKNAGTLLGRTWDKEFSGRYAMSQIERSVVDAVGAGARDLDPGKRNLLGWRRSTWGIANFPIKGRATQQDIDIFARAIADNMFLLSDDPLIRFVANGVPWDDAGVGKLYAGLDRAVEGATRTLMDESVDAGAAFDLPVSIKRWLLETPEGQKRASQMNNMWKSKTPLPDGSGPRFDYSFYDEATGVLDDVNWQTYLDEYVRPRIDAVVGKNDALRQVLLGSPDGMPKVKIAQRYKGGEIVKDANGKPVMQTKPVYDRTGAELLDEAGNVVTQQVPRTRRAGEIVTDADGNIQYKFVDAYKKLFVEPGLSDAYGGYSDELMDEIRSFVRAAMDDPEVGAGLSRSLKYQIDELSGADKYGNEAQGRWGAITDHFFGSVFGKKEALLNRSPAFREFYYEIVSQTTPAMRQEDASFVLNRLLFQHDGKPREYLEALNKAVSRERNGVMQYRVPVSLEDFGKKLTPGRWVGVDEYERLVAAAKKAVDETPQRVLNGDDIELLLKSFKSREAAEQFAAKYGSFNAKWGSDFMGGKDRFEALVRQATQRISVEDQTKMLSAEQIDFAAKAYAIEQTKKLFYDASQKSNLADIAQIISPFGSSWAELIKTYSREMLKTPSRMRNAGMVVQNVNNASTGGDARGFMYRDPNTGELMFNFPLSSELVPFIAGFGGFVAGQTLAGPGRSRFTSTLAGLAGASGFSGITFNALNQPGLETQVGAPVRSLSMGLPLGPSGDLSLIPGFGPVIQMTANTVLGDKPQYREVMEKIAPYGAEKLTPLGVASQFTPAWLEKLTKAIVSNPRTDQQFADIYMDTLRALSASGDFDLTNPAEKQELVRQAKQYAKNLMVYAALGQFTGPVRPRTDFIIPVEYEGVIDTATVEGLKVEGHIPTNFLSSVYRSFQEEDFENAPLRMIETFGPNVLLYMGPSTVTAEGVKGLGVSRSFGDWEGENQDFAERHPQVFGYFAPTGDDFDYQTYLRQLQTNQRNRVVEPELLIASAEAVIGKALYRAFRRSQGTVQSEFNDAMATEYRELLYKQYPGFANEALNLNELDATINRLQSAVYDPALDTNEAAIAMRLYFERRDEAIRLSRARRRYDGRQMALGSPLSAAADTDLRIQLRFFGEKLAREYPQFERVWSRELFDEVDA